MNGVLARFLPWFAVPLATIVTLRAIDAYRWVGIGAVLVNALTILTLRRIAGGFSDRDDTRGDVIAFVVLVIRVAFVFFTKWLPRSLGKTTSRRLTSVNIMRR